MNERRLQIVEENLSAHGTVRTLRTLALKAHVNNENNVLYRRTRSLGHGKKEEEKGGC